MNSPIASEYELAGVNFRKYTVKSPSQKLRKNKNIVLASRKSKSPIAQKTRSSSRIARSKSNQREFNHSKDPNLDKNSLENQKSSPYTEKQPLGSWAKSSFGAKAKKVLKKLYGQNLISLDRIKNQPSLPRRNSKSRQLVRDNKFLPPIDFITKRSESVTPQNKELFKGEFISMAEFENLHLLWQGPNHLEKVIEDDSIFENSAQENY